MSEQAPFVIAVALMAAAIGVFAIAQWRAIRRRGGVAGVLAGADIERTVVDVAAVSGGGPKGRCRVHRFASPAPERVVGIEIKLQTPLSYDSMTAALSPREARALADLLRGAIGEPAERPARRTGVRDGPI